MLLPFRLRAVERLALLAACLTLFAPPALARSDDRDKPLDVQAGGLDGVMTQDGDTRFTDLVITQGSLRIDAAEATVTRVAGEVTRVLLKGSPASLQQENDEGQLMRARAQQIVYDTGTEIVVLSGDVQVEQGRDTFRGDRVRYDTRNGRIQGGGGEGGRIHLTIQPKPRATGN